MLWTSKIKSFVVTGDDNKDAYLKGCKQYATYIASSKYQHLSLDVKQTGEKGKLIFTIYASVNVSEEQSAFCKVCKNTHKLFYVNDSYNCSCCTLKSFLSRVEQKTRTQKSFYKKHIE